MFKSKNNFKTNLNGYYDIHDSGNLFPINKYITTYSEYPPCFLYISEAFKSEVLNFLLENGSLIYSSCTGNLKNLLKDTLSFKSGTIIFEYKDVFIKIMVKDEVDDSNSTSFVSTDGEIVEFSSIIKEEKQKENSKKTYEMVIIYTSNVEDLHLKDFEQFIAKQESSKIHLYVKNRYDEYVFDPIDMKIPDDINIELNYGSKFVSVEKQIIERLNNDDNGLYMFHGAPGAGKSTFLKYLTTKVNKDFIYIPATMIESFVNDPTTFSSLLKKKNSVLILEDAEKAIVKRMGDNYDSSAVTSLLNLSDGILGDVLRCPLVITYNCPKQDIDDALRRKGRLQVDYEFGPINIEDAKKLAKHLGFSKKEIEENITKNMVIADIYNLTKKTEMNENKKEEKRIGFGK
jgi:energy-coupling factor transporter ATP-binding protein EcfA2